MIIRKIKGTLNTLFAPKFENKEFYINRLKGKSGIEIGGPSNIFSNRGFLKIYPQINSLDNCNFNNSTVWEGKLEEGQFFQFGNKKGFQYIREASNLAGIENEKYDFLLSSHCLEHCANAVKTLKEWIRVVKSGGYLLIILPNKEGTFDHNRPLTTMNHFIDDERNNVGENDMTHFDEIMEFHDLSMDKLAGTKENFIERSKHNFENRCLHQHTFNSENFKELINYVGLKVVKQDFMVPFHLIILAQKL